MVALRFDARQVKGFERGIEYAAAVRGFEVCDNGIFVNVCCGDGIVVQGDGREYNICYEKKTDFFRALSMLVGFLETGENNFLVNEKSSLEMCGAMIDCSRYGVPKKETVIDIIVRTALMGMNTLMLYTEDVYELDGYRYFGYMRGRYTKDELKLFDEIAECFGIEMIPCIQTLGHLEKALRWDYAGEMKDDNDVLLIDEEQTYAFIESMFKLWREVFKTDKIHIGMDEAENVGLGNYLKKHGLCDRFEIMSRHVERVCDIAKKYGFTPMMWSDMFFKFGSKKHDYYDLDSQIPENLHTQIPENISMVYWDYYHEDKDFYLGMLSKHEKLKRNIIFAGGAWVWRGWAPQYKKTFDTTVPALSACREKGIKNIITTMWQDDGAETNIYTMLLGLQLFAEYNYYKEVDMDVLKEHFKLCTGLDADVFLNMELDDINWNRDDAVGVTKQIFYQDLFMGLYDKNLEAFDFETFYSEKLKRLEKTKVNGEFFEKLISFYKLLVKILKIKAHLGIKIRNGYKKGDKEGLLVYANETERLIELYKEFHKCFCEIWNKTNKAFGMEFTEERLGGMILRFSSVAQRLKDYSQGRIAIIEELEEDVLWYGGENSRDKLVPNHFYSFGRI